MLRVVQIASLFVVFVSAGFAQEPMTLSYRPEYGLGLAIEAEGTAEGRMWGNAPGMEKLVFQTKEKRKLVATPSGDSYGNTMDWKMAGEVAVEGTFNGQPREPMTEPLDPVVFTFDERGQVVGTKPVPFETSPQNLMRFRWWRYIAQQLDLPPVLPDDAVKPGATWDSEVNLTGPDGKPLKGKAEFRFLGASGEPEGQTAWLRGEMVVPIKLEFKSDEGEYKVEGKVRLDRLYAFDIDKGMPRGNSNRAVVDMSITVKRAEGEEFHIQLFMQADGKTTMKPRSADAEEPKAGGSKTDELKQDEPKKEE